MVARILWLGLMDYPPVNKISIIITDYNSLLKILSSSGDTHNISTTKRFYMYLYSRKIRYLEQYVIKYIFLSKVITMLSLPSLDLEVKH